MHFASLLREIDLPAGVLNFVTGGGSTLGETLSSSSMTDMVSLTGSVEAGQRIITAGARTISPRFRWNWAARLRPLSAPMPIWIWPSRP